MSDAQDPWADVRIPTAWCDACAAHVVVHQTLDRAGRWELRCVDADHLLPETSVIDDVPFDDLGALGYAPAGSTRRGCGAGCRSHPPD